ncbi:hypothetical protein CF326_g3427 [Tilletia indica]|nr:hypothetical protein CF326_g3427 [Tilletia indica]
MASSIFSTSTPNLPALGTYPRKNFVPPPPSFHSPQPRIASPLTRSDDESASKRTFVSSPSAAFSPPRNKYPPSASQSYKLSPSVTSPLAIPGTRGRSSSTASATKSLSSLTRSSTQGTSVTGRSPGFSAFSPSGSPAAPRHRRTSSSASTAAFALTKVLRGRLNRSDTDGAGYYDSDESWDDGDLDPMSEFALPGWKLEHASRTSEDVRTSSLNTPSPVKKPLIGDATLRGWTMDSEPIPTKEFGTLGQRPIVRKFSDNFAPSTKHRSPTSTTGRSPRFQSPKSPFKSPTPKTKTDPSVATSSTGRGSPLLLSSRPQHVKQASSLTLAHSSSSEPDSSALLPPFLTPPIQTVDLPMLCTDSEVEERLEDDLKLESRSPRPFPSRPAQNRSLFSKESSSGTVGNKDAAAKRSVVKKKSSGSLSTSDISYPTSHQVVNLKVPVSGPRRTMASPRALSFDEKRDQLGLFKQHDVFDTSADQTPKPPSAQNKTSVSISSIRKASNLALGRKNGSDSDQLARTQTPAAPPSRPSTPPPFSDLITMPTPTARQSKAERILGLSAGAAAAIRASATSTAQIVQAPQPITSSATANNNTNPYVRVRSPFELLPRSVTPQPASTVSGIKKYVGSSSTSGPKKEVAFVQPAATGSVPLLSYDPRRRPKEALQSKSQESLHPSDGSGSSASAPDTPDSLQKTTDLPWVPATLASLSRALPQAKGAPSIIRKLSAKRTGMGAAASFGKAVLGGPPMRPQRASDLEIMDSQGGENQDESYKLSVSDASQRHQRLGPGSPINQVARSPRFELRDHQLLPPLPERKQAPAFAPPTVPLQSLPPTPIEKDSWLARQKAAYAATQASQSSALILEKKTSNSGAIFSSESLPFMDDSYRTSEDSPSDARPSSPEIDAGLRLQVEEEKVAQAAEVAANVAAAAKLADVVGPISPPAVQDAPVVAQVAVKPVAPFHATMLGTQLIPASDLEGRKLYDLDNLSAAISSRKRRIIIQLKVRKETFWASKDIFLANGSNGGEEGRLVSMLRNTSNMAEQMFGPDEFEDEPATSTLKPRPALTPSRTPMSETASFEFNLQHPFHLGCSGASKSTLEVDLTPTSANCHLSSPGTPASTPSPILSPSSVGSTIVFTPKAPVSLRASNTSTFARALGPLVAQQAAYVARLRIQQQEVEGRYGEDGDHTGWGGPSDVTIDENDWDHEQENEAEPGSNFLDRSPPHRERRTLTLSRVEEEDQVDSRCSMSSWFHGRSPSPDLFPSRRPSEMVRLAEEEMEEPGMVPHITIEPAIPSIEIEEEAPSVPSSPGPDRMHILITLKLDRDPNPYPSILAALCKDRNVRSEGRVQDIESSSSGHSGEHVRSSVRLQSVDVGTISRRRRGLETSVYQTSLSSDSDTDADQLGQNTSAPRTWSSKQENEEAAWLGIV